MTREDLRKQLNQQGGQFPGVYKITHKATSKPYIGQSICIVDRIDEHIDKPDKATDGIDAAIQKYGWEAFDYEVLEALPEATTNLLWYREAVLIEKFDAYKTGYNKTIGNGAHCSKIWADIKKFNAKHIVPKEVLKQIPLTNKPKLLLHNFEKRYLDRLEYDEIPYRIINKDFVAPNIQGKLVEDVKELGNYMVEELNKLKEDITLPDDLEVISNPPFGVDGARITKTIVKDINYDTFYNLEPGNDYFENDLYKYLDPTFKPIIYPIYSIPDAEQVIVLSRLQKEKNNLSEIEARILLHLTADPELYEALKEYILKVNVNNTPLEFSLSKLTRRKTDVTYDENLFMFNSGSFDIAHGYYAVMAKDRTNWTDAIRFNILKQNITTGSDIPAAFIKGCTSFKKILISQHGLCFMRLLFTALPEGWGLKNLFADIDYNGLKSLADMFNAIGLSNVSQNIIFSRISGMTLTNKEIEICKVAESL